MGYRKVPTIYTLTDLEDLDGLVVRMRAIRIGKLRKLMQIVSADDQDEAAMDGMFGLVEEGLVSWNLEDETGQPVPATLVGIEEQELPLILTIMNAWLTQMTGPSAGLGKGSPSGATFPGQPLTMEAL